MSSHISTKERLLAIIDDFEIIAKELIENTSAPKQQKISEDEHATLVELLLSKDHELTNVLKLACEQAEIDRQMAAVQAKVDLRDEEIKKLQRHLKDCEEALARSIFQARRKLANIAVANKRPIASEEIIKYAYRISASNAICAPQNWQQGDLRRPYPTDIEMRLGFLGRPDIMNGQNGQRPTNAPSELQRSMTGGPSQMSWLPGELHIRSGITNSSPTIITDNRRRNSTSEDIEVMSTENSSSSSNESK